MVRYLPREDYEQERARLDGILEIESWSQLLPRPRPVQRPVDAPWWWRGDEDASASFIESMGINLDD